METGKFVCGDTVWAKIPNCPWWPAEVIDEKDCPIPLPDAKAKRKPVVASIKFLAEDQYSIITSLTNIQPFLVPHYKELKLKGERDKRESLRSKFGTAFRLGLERVGLLPMTSPPDGASCSQTPEVAECPRSESPSGPRVRKPVEKFGVTLPPSPKVKRGVKRRTCSVGSTTPSNPKSRNCSMSESPSIPYPCENNSASPSIPYPCERKPDKLNGLDRAGVQPSLVESVNAVKRSLESDYISASPGTGFRLAESIGIMCKLSPVKTISDSFTTLSHRGEVTQAEEKELISCKSASISSFDSNLCSESDSDEDLPEGISPSITATTGMPDVRDVVWVKYRKNPFWPAVVRRIQKTKKRGRSKKIQVQFLGDTGHFKESFYLTYNKSTVLPLDNPHRKEFQANGESCQNPDLKKRFKSSLVELEAYLNKKALGLLPQNKEDSFFDEDYTSDSPDEIVKGDEQSEDLDSEIPESTVSPRTERREEKQRKMCEDMKEIRKKKNQALLEHLLSEEMKAYMLDIYHERRKSERHLLYRMSARERESLKHSGFGPIADEEQQDLVTYQFVEWYKSDISTKVDINYILDVLVPEAIVYSLVKRKKYSRRRGWAMFHKGFQPYRAERQLMHEHLIKTASNISPSDRQLYDERRQERWQMMLSG